MKTVIEWNTDQFDILLEIHKKLTEFIDSSPELRGLCLKVDTELHNAKVVS